jgi:hypothetical protein
MSKRNSNIKFEEYYDFAYFVWADEGMLQVIRDVDGVASARVEYGYSTKYFVNIDERYNAKSVLSSIKDAIIWRHDMTPKGQRKETCL